MTAAPKRDTFLERSLPSSVDAERSVLGSILLDNRLCYAAREHLTPADFYLEAHRLIYEKMVLLSACGYGIDPVTLGEELRRSGEYEQAGGGSYIAGLPDSIPRLENVDHYIRIVKEKSTLRGLISASNATIAECFEEELLPADISRRAQHRYARAARAGEQADSDEASEIFEALDADMRRGGGVGLMTGFTRLDRLTFGIQPDDLWFVAAYTSVGKSSLAVAVALYVASGGHYVDFLSYEMNQRRVMRRFIASGWGIEIGNLRSNRMTPEESNSYEMAREWMKASRLRIVSAAGRTTDDIRARAHRLKSEGKLDLMITDYIGLVPAARRHASRASEIAAISRDLKIITTEVECPNIVLAQINREGHKSGEEPQLWWLKDSGGQENDADVVLFIMREEGSDAAGVYAKKNRDGQLGDFPLRFEARCARYTDEK